MANEADNPFDSIESAYQYMRVLGDVLNETRGAIQDDIAAARTAPPAARRLDALQLVDYKLERLGYHFAASRRLLNDLGLLRRLLLREPGGEPEGPLESLSVAGQVTQDDSSREPVERD
jgi:hypothetical protein